MAKRAKCKRNLAPASAYFFSFLFLNNGELLACGRSKKTYGRPLFGRQNFKHNISTWIIFYFIFFPASPRRYYSAPSATRSVNFEEKNSQSSTRDFSSAIISPAALQLRVSPFVCINRRTTVQNGPRFSEIVWCTRRRLIFSAGTGLFSSWPVDE